MGRGTTDGVGMHLGGLARSSVDRASFRGSAHVAGVRVSDPRNVVVDDSERSGSGHSRRFRDVRAAAALPS